jgi:hypothetical protein
MSLKIGLENKLLFETAISAERFEEGRGEYKSISITTQLLLIIDPKIN